VEQVVLKKAGAENTPTVFIFSDTQLKLQQFLEDINNILNTGEIDIDESFQEPVRDMCMLFHQHAATLAVSFLQEAQRFIYVTPTSYLELLATYKDLLQKKRKEIDSIRTRYGVGKTVFCGITSDCHEGVTCCITTNSDQNC
jgi:hypothetical protein